MTVVDSRDFDWLHAVSNQDERSEGRFVCGDATAGGKALFACVAGLREKRREQRKKRKGRVVELPDEFKKFLYAELKR